MAAGEEKGRGRRLLRASEGVATWGQGHDREAALKVFLFLPASTKSPSFASVQTILRGVCSTRSSSSSPSPRVDSETQTGTAHQATRVPENLAHGASSSSSKPTNNVIVTSRARRDASGTIRRRSAIGDSVGWVWRISSFSAHVLPFWTPSER
jgi:hypothetical protein